MCERSGELLRTVQRRWVGSLDVHKQYSSKFPPGRAGSRGGRRWALTYRLRRMEPSGGVVRQQARHLPGKTAGHQPCPSSPPPIFIIPAADSHRSLSARWRTPTRTSDDHLMGPERHQRRAPRHPAHTHTKSPTLAVRSRCRWRLRHQQGMLQYHMMPSQ